MQMNMLLGRSKLCLTVFLVGVLMPTIVMASTIKDLEAQLAQDAATERPFPIKSRSQFACAEVATGRNGGQVSHEINLAPNKIERCELIKVGSRLHECKKYRFRNSTVNGRGVVSIDTEDGPLQFWFDQEARITASEESKITAGTGKGTLTFIWPDKNRKYLCAAMR